MNDEDFKAYLRETGGYTHVRKLDDGTWAGIFQFIFTWGVCTELNMTGYGRRYCYKSESQAIGELGKMQSASDVPQGFERRLPEPFYFTIVGYEGIPHTIGQCMTERQLITHANLAGPLGRADAPLDHPSPENIDKAINMINTGAARFEAFNVDSQAEAFLLRAKELGLAYEAGQVIKSVIQFKFL